MNSNELEIESILKRTWFVPYTSTPWSGHGHMNPSSKFSESPTKPIQKNKNILFYENSQNVLVKTKSNSIGFTQSMETDLTNYCYFFKNIFVPLRKVSKSKARFSFWPQGKAQTKIIPPSTQKTSGSQCTRRPHSSPFPSFPF